MKMYKRALVLSLAMMLLCAMSAPVVAQEQSTVQGTGELTVESVLDILPDSTDDNADLSRGAFAAMLAYAAGISPVEDINREELPPDLRSDAWYAPQMAALYKRNILKGYPDKKICPDSPITGIEAIALIARTLGVPEHSPAEDVNVEGVQKNHWGYILYSWLEKGGLASGLKHIAEPIKPDEAAEILVNVFGTDKEAKAILDEANEKNKDINSMRAKGAMSMKINMETQDGSLLPVNTDATFNSEISKDMVIHQIVETSVPDIAKSGALQKITIEEYLDKDYIYVLAGGQDGQKKWMKMKNPVPMAFDKQFISQQKEMMKGFEGMVHYRLLGNEMLDGKKVYKIAVYSRIDDMVKLFDMLGSVGEQEKQALGAANSIIKSIYMSGIMYVGVEDKLVYKADIAATISMDAEKQKGSPAVISSMEMEASYDYYDYNADINAVIPDEAKNAEEIDLNNPDATKNAQ
ncbi:MAG: S-layer homology domain-containing protein [Tepidanaerobacteraceae bacterium]|jgi:hypothetical protein|nr:S-layer homology domain-containing protein [Tepidanaerobacteraceae bacterium]